MAQTVTVSKSTINELFNRLERLEKIVYENEEVFQAVKTYKNEKQKGQLKKLKNTDELFT